MDSTIRERLIGRFHSVLPGPLLGGDLTESSPLEFELERAVCAAFVRTRGNGTEILQIGVDVGCFDENVEALRYIARHAADGTYGSLSASFGSPTCDLDVTIWHTLIADTVTRDGLSEVLDSLGTVARYHRENLESLPGHQVPEWLSFDPSTLTAKVTAVPTSDQVPFQVDMNLIIEFYR